MKALIAAVALISSTTVFAGEATLAEKVEFCENNATVAKLAVKNRYLETPLSRMLEIVGEVSSFRAIVINAYSQPYYQHDAVREQQAQRYASNTQAKCLKEVL